MFARQAITLLTGGVCDYSDADSVELNLLGSPGLQRHAADSDSNPTTTRSLAHPEVMSELWAGNGAYALMEWSLPTAKSIRSTGRLVETQIVGTVPGAPDSCWGGA